jgi:DNA-binding NtrC family response regulator
LTVLIIDKNNIVRERVAGLLSRLDNVTHVTQGKSCDNLLEFLSLTNPDCLLIEHAQYQDALHPDLERFLEKRSDINVCVYVEDSDWEALGNEELSGAAKMLSFSELIEYVQACAESLKRKQAAG